MSEKQILFPFIREMNITDGMTCSNCKYREDNECHRWGEDVELEHSCGEWQYNTGE